MPWTSEQQREYQLNYQKDRKKRLRDAGLCYRCRNVLDRKGRYCSFCLERMRKYQKNLYKRRRNAGMCRRCGRFKIAAPSKIHCVSCRMRVNRLSLLRQYGWIESDYQAMLVFQKGLCALCGDKMSSSLVIDHNHSTGKVRGLVHSRCNFLIGLVESPPNYREMVDKYLKERA